MFQHFKLLNCATLLLHFRHSPRSWHVFEHKNGVYNIFYLHNTFVFEQLNDFVSKKGLSQTLEQNPQSIWWTCSVSSSNYFPTNRFGCRDDDINCKAKRILQFNSTIESIFRCKNCKIELLAPWNRSCSIWAFFNFMIFDEEMSEFRNLRITSH